MSGLQYYVNDYIERKAKEAQQAKAAQWAEIQRRDPYLAEFLKKLAKVFGKVELIKGVKYDV